jgi:mannose-6-phosphate isomerase-like protein (cupin superfamily)
MNNPYHVSIEEAIKLLNEQDKTFVRVMEEGKMTVEYYVPKKIDTQQPHNKNEIYIIASGTTDFFRAGDTIKCKKGDAIHVPAQMEHRFINFSDDFATWVIFYGEEIY